VLAWFAVMWVAIFLGASIVPLLQNLYGQLLFNLVIVMLGGSLLMIRRYRLDPREALALRPVKPVVVLAVVLGAPGLFLTGVALARLSGALFPLPERLLEEFARTLMPEAMPLWKTLAILAVLPGICEEVAFRGVLLHGLRRRFSPPVLCLVVGLIFGLFHLDLVRILPTAFLGVTVAAVTLVTGSLYPAMLWHALHNATAFLASDAGIQVEELGAGVYLSGALVAALAFALLWRNRTPYLGLRRGWLREKKKRGA
jgi:membrane protease YdiL (CAAX protease family)